MNQHYVTLLENKLRASANPAEAAAMAAYMRDLFPFLGIKKPERAALTRDFLTEHGLPETEEELLQVVRTLWALPEREFHYTAIVLLEKRMKKAKPERAPLLEQLIVTYSWWDTVDLLAGKLAGSLFELYPELRGEYVPRWTESDDLWLRRSVLLFQLHYKERTDAQLLFALIRRFAGEEDFFIRKAIGWALREYSKTDAQAVRNFVAAEKLSPLSVREALKWLDAHPSNND
ncbi:3-methyladenine DNA glycosylase AlkD [Paenibacillus phyllosphaerae]|uniref:3-methyladenine DNA glycosylase AlkD n=1 Tax=Paenibacillus phyllosphaerae TaxID=274593 RepID=A0A7W5FN37_9BACL|nr:DNA alkylation repair protein [Paenibacillus phyllosphaerae]MBB3110639.1 3-methyladenine DNA glycosylase AlkD [Paenibacillus phyllosphaerae]